MNGVINGTTTEKPFYRSKKFWYAVAIGVAAMAKEMGVEIPPEALYAGLALILGQGLADLSKNAQKAPETAVEAPVSEKPTQTTNQVETLPSLRAGDKAIPSEAPTPFDVVAFDKAVTQRAKDTYGKVSATHKFFSARELGTVTRATNIDQAVDYWNYLVGLADSAFTETWGYDVNEAKRRVSEPGCPKCKGGCGGFTNLKTKAGFLGPEFYGSYLDLERMKTSLSELEGVKNKNLDWKAKLYPQHHTLYHLGEMAKYLL